MSDKKPQATPTVAPTPAEPAGGGAAPKPRMPDRSFSIEVTQEVKKGVNPDVHIERSVPTEKKE